jgi:hypothetical protein
LRDPHEEIGEFNTMRAMVLREHGAPEKLRLETDFPDPEPREGDVVLRMRASSLNYDMSSPAAGCRVSRSRCQ